MVTFSFVKYFFKTYKKERKKKFIFWPFMKIKPEKIYIKIDIFALESYFYDS